MTKLEECEQHWYRTRSLYLENVKLTFETNGLVPPPEYPGLSAYRGIHDDAWHAGARWALMESSKLSPHIARFLDMLILLGIPEEAAERPYPTLSASQELPGGEHHPASATDSI